MTLNLIGKNPANGSAVIAFYNKKVVLHLRSKKKNIFYPNHWGLFGGAKYSNELYKKAAIREFNEETSIKLDERKLFFFIRLYFNFPRKKKMICRKFYIYKIKDINKFESKFKLCEGIKKKFFSNHQYQKLKKVTPYDKLAIDLFFHNIKYFNN